MARDMKAQAIANTIWALGRLMLPLDEEPGASIIAGCWVAAERVLDANSSDRQPSFDPQNISNMLWTCATLCTPPPSRVLEGILGMLKQQNMLQRLNRQDGIAAERLNRSSAPFNQQRSTLFCGSAKHCMVARKAAYLARRGHRLRDRGYRARAMDQLYLTGSVQHILWAV